MRLAYKLVLLFSCVWLSGCGCHPPDPALHSPLPETPAQSTQQQAAATGGSRDLVETPAESTPQQAAVPETPAQSTAQQAAATDGWRNLFDGETLANWKVTRFGGEGDVYVKDGTIMLDFGQYMTGITYDGDDLPTNNYEVELEAKRVDGLDFFCALTFPVDDSYCSFVVGGWGGSVVGISSIDDMDASENDTTDYMNFTLDQWYKIRVRVTPGVLEAWIDDKRIVNQDVTGSRLSTRIEVDLNQPLGICSFDTQAALRNIRLRELE